MDDSASGSNLLHVETVAVREAYAIEAEDLLIRYIATGLIAVHVPSIVIQWYLSGRFKAQSSIMEHAHRSLYTKDQCGLTRQPNTKLLLYMDLRLKALLV